MAREEAKEKQDRNEGHALEKCGIGSYIVLSPGTICYSSSLHR